jgi:hypothetical protein
MHWTRVVFAVGVVTVAVTAGGRDQAEAQLRLPPVQVGPVSVGPVSVGPVSVGPVSLGPTQVGPVQVPEVQVPQVEVPPAPVPDPAPAPRVPAPDVPSAPAPSSTDDGGAPSTSPPVAGGTATVSAPPAPPPRASGGGSDRRAPRSGDRIDRAPQRPAPGATVRHRGGCLDSQAAAERRGLRTDGCGGAKHVRAGTPVGGADSGASGLAPASDSSERASANVGATRESAARSPFASYLPDPADAGVGLALSAVLVLLAAAAGFATPSLRDRLRRG